MSEFKNKVDFMLFVSVDMANPNGDPLNGNRPRDDYDGYGEISDVCIKRKIRNRMQDMGQEIFVQSKERTYDEFKSLSDRAKKTVGKEMGKEKDDDKYARLACEKWLDVRTFGQVFAFKSDSISVGVRGPVSIHQGKSLSPVDILSMQITKSVNSEPSEKKSSDTMGTKHMVRYGLYQIKGSINVQLAEKTGFTLEDSQIVKEALKTLFENDASAARPDGSMQVYKMYWWEHNCSAGQYSSAIVHKSVKFRLKDGVDVPKCPEDYIIEYNELDGLKCEIIDGI